MLSQDLEKTTEGKWLWKENQVNSMKWGKGCRCWSTLSFETQKRHYYMSEKEGGLHLTSCPSLWVAIETVNNTGSQNRTWSLQTHWVMEADTKGTNLQIESVHLVKTLLEKHRRGAMKNQVDTTVDTDIRDINWTTCKDFTIEVGRIQIGEYIQTWELQPCWLYTLDFFSSYEEDHLTVYHYRARFSNPTPQEPIPPTASVYFVVGISKVKPQTQPVEVLFVVESNRLVHTPGRTRFREKWLADVTRSKALLWRAMNLWNDWFCEDVKGQFLYRSVNMFTL